MYFLKKKCMEQTRCKERCLVVYVATKSDAIILHHLWTLKNACLCNITCGAASLSLCFYTLLLGKCSPVLSTDCHMLLVDKSQIHFSSHCVSAEFQDCIWPSGKHLNLGVWQVPNSTSLKPKWRMLLNKGNKDPNTYILRESLQFEKHPNPYPLHLCSTRSIFISHSFFSKHMALSVSLSITHWIPSCGLQYLNFLFIL